jgi:hypothetical protein
MALVRFDRFDVCEVQRRLSVTGPICTGPMTLAEIYEAESETPQIGGARSRLLTGAYL